MNHAKLNSQEREAPHSHLIQGISPLIFIIVHVLDSIIFRWSTQLNQFVPLWLRVILLIILLAFGLSFIQLAHKALFNKNNPSDKLVTKGVLKIVRNPMYLGILLIYVAFIFFSISLISVFTFLIIVIFYNYLVNVEDQILEQLFGEEYLEYKKRVPKWIPKLF